MAEPKIEDPQLTILLCGTTGVGKSSLLNSLLGKKVCKVSRHPGLPGANLAHCTKVTQKYVVKLAGITVNVFDSPGLQDGTGKETEYVADMYSKCKDVDLVLYCVDMNAPRLTPRDIGVITKKFGVKFWERCVLVLTKANCLYIPPEYRAPLATIEYHENVFKNIQAEFCSHLEEFKVSKSDLQNHTVATGLIDNTNDNPDRFIHYASKHVKASIKKCGSEKDKLELVDFIAELWVVCLGRVPTESRNRYLQATALGGRIVVNDDGSRQSKEVRELLEKSAKELNVSIRQKSEILVPIVVSHPSQLQRILDNLKHPTTMSGLGGAAAGAAVGFIAGGPVGAAIGVVAGGVGGLAVRVAYSWFTGSKKEKVA